MRSVQRFLEACAAARGINKFSRPSKPLSRRHPRRISSAFLHFCVSRIMKVIGKPRRRVDGRAKVTGQTKFADDIVLPRMVVARLMRSTVPHARIVGIDTSR